MKRFLLAFLASTVTAFAGGIWGGSGGTGNETGLTLSDITTNDVSTSKHGFAPKAPNDVTKFLNGLGAWSVPSAGSASWGAITGTLSAQTDLGLSLDGKQIKHGFDGRTGSSMSFAAGTFTLTVPTSQVVYVGGTKVTLTSNKTIAVSGDLVTKFITMDNTGTLAVSNTAWDITSFSAIPVATLYLDGANYCLGDERHSCNRNVMYHEEHHKTIGSVYQSGLTGTFTNTTLSMAQGVIYDEDLALDTGGTVTTNGWFYRNTGRTAMRLESGKTTPYAVSAGALQYDNSGALASVASGSYVVNWIYATNCSVNPIVCVISQSQYSNSGDAAQAALSTLSGFSTLEWKLLYSVTYRNVGGTPTYISSADYRRSSLGPATASIANTHAALTGRDAADSHPATAISNTPAGFISATTVQAAINELDTEKLTKGTESGTNATATYGATASGTDAIAIGNDASSPALASSTNAIAIGASSIARTSAGTIAIGSHGSVQTIASGANAVAIGTGANATSTSSVQLGQGTNSSASTLQFRANKVADDNGLAITAGSGISLSKDTTGVTISASGSSSSFNPGSAYNIFDNGNFIVAQRSTSTPGANISVSCSWNTSTPLVDRWRINVNQGTSGTVTVSRPAITNDPPTGSLSSPSPHYLSAGIPNTATGFQLSQRFRAEQVAHLKNLYGDSANAMITFLVKPTAAQSSTAQVEIYTCDSANTFPGTQRATSTASLTGGAWQRHSVDIGAAAGSNLFSLTNIDNGFEVRITLKFAVGDSGNSFKWTDFQFNVGTTANSFIAPDYNTELWKCYPFLQRYDFDGSSAEMLVGKGGATDSYAPIIFRRKMVAVPAFTFSGDIGDLKVEAGGYAVMTCTSVDQYAAGTHSAKLHFVHNSIPIPTGAVITVQTTAASTNESFIFASEP